MISISLCMIVKNEEQVLARCLDSASDIVDEIIIIDTGSIDSTKSIANKYTKNVFDFQWIDDFSKARNFSFSKATKDYILWLDADDVIENIDKEKFIELKNSLDPNIDSVVMEYKLASDEYGNPTFITHRNRLVKRNNHFQWIGAVHEYLQVNGNIHNSNISITHNSLSHDSDRNINIYEKRLTNGEEFSPRDLFYFANELYDHQFYERAITYYEKFLSSNKGWVEDNLSTCSKLADCYNKLNMKDNEINSILTSFKLDSPRSEFCCRLGNFFLELNLTDAAIFWYKMASQLKTPNNSLGFYQPMYSTWIPHLQLCVCYHKIGEYKLSYLHNELALQYRPNDPNILNNKKFLETLIYK